MLSNFSQYAPQGLAPQVPGMPPIGPNPWLGHELGLQGVGQQAPPWAGQFNPFVQNPVQQIPVHIVPVLGQLAQQLTIQCALCQQIAQQISSAVQHLAHQLALQSAQGQYYGQNPLAASIQGGYSGFNPQTQAWGVTRPSTIQ